ncbi:MAG: hypothetical protein NVSMB6_27620 [Burkholderiaceae bacterium]
MLVFGLRLVELIARDGLLIEKILIGLVHAAGFTHIRVGIREVRIGGDALISGR